MISTDIHYTKFPSCGVHLTDDFIDDEDDVQFIYSDTLTGVTCNECLKQSNHDHDQRNQNRKV